MIVLAILVALCVLLAIRRDLLSHRDRFVAMYEQYEREWDVLWEQRLLEGDHVGAARCAAFSEKWSRKASAMRKFSTWRMHLWLFANDGDADAMLEAK